MVISFLLDVMSGRLATNNGALGGAPVHVGTTGIPAATSPFKNSIKQREREGGIVRHPVGRLVVAVGCLLVTSVVVRVQRLAMCPPLDASTTSLGVRSTPKTSIDSFLREMEDLETNLTNRSTLAAGMVVGLPPIISSSWSHTPDGHDVCTSFVTTTDAQHMSSALSPSMVWQLLSSAIANASYFPATYANDTRFQHWVQDMFGFYTTDRLRRSVAHPPSNRAMQQILSLIAHRLSDPTQHDPIRILVLGGSVTQGLACTANSIGLPEAFWMHPQLECAWPARLEHMLNHALFQGKSIFEVRNLAVPGSNSEVGAMVLEYQLLPDLYHHVPHMILSSYSANDAQDPDPHATFHIHQQALVRATQRLRPCNDDLPLLVLVDDLFADMPSQAIQQTGSLYKIASWYNAMAIAYSNVARHQVVTHPTVNASGASIPNPLLGTPFNTVHLGMGFHIGVAWTVLFNFVSAFQEACHANPASLFHNDNDGDPFKRMADSALPTTTDSKNGTSSSTATSSDASTTTTTVWMEWPTKDRGPIGTGTTSQIRDEWLHNRAQRNEQCQAEQQRLAVLATKQTNRNGTADALPPQQSLYSTPVCAYAWMVNRQTSIYETKHVKAALAPVLQTQNGWAASGYPIKQPRTGFYASEQNATFDLELRDISQDAKYLTVLSMKSYGPTWVGSKLRLHVSVMRKAAEAAAPSPPVAAEATYEIDGYHAVKTSVHFPHKFPVPGDGAKSGDTIRVNATLVSGSTFKIAGLAFCQY